LKALTTIPQEVSLGVHELFQEDPYIPDTLRVSPPFYSLYRKPSNFQTDEHTCCVEKSVLLERLSLETEQMTGEDARRSMLVASRYSTGIATRP